MCMRTTSVIGTGGWNWAGDDVVFDRIVPSKRKIANSKLDYEIDIRQFLTSTNNAIIRRAMDEAVGSLKSASERELFFRRHDGAFDHRVLVLAAYVGRKITYQARKGRRSDAWQFPEETLALGAGDCEDLAFLLASLLLASGLSGYMLRVALGHLVTRNAAGYRIKDRDHAWVMYQNEQGHWVVLDPLLYFKQSAKASPKGSRGINAKERFEYVPHFVFNDAHLWAIRRNDIDVSLPDYVGRRRFFKEFDPGFAVGVHNHIFDSALKGMSWFNRQYVKAASLAVDANVATYDPRDHFDNGYINEGFALIERRLSSKSIGDFALAAHAIGDFYAHSTYEVFGQVKNGRLLAYDPSQPMVATIPDYGADSVCPLAESRFTVNTGTYSGTREDAAKHWRGKVISGRYAQNGDPNQGAAERVTYIPSTLRQQADYPPRAMLPHHNEIAVDSPIRSAEHRLYQDPNTYAQAFERRQAAAIEHVKLVYQRWLQ